jgi:primosomal protein N'
VVDESHPGHCERSQPYTNSRDIAVARSAAFGAALVLVSSGPSVRALAGRVKAFPVGGSGDWPVVQVVNLHDEDPLAAVPASVAAAARRPGAVVVVERSPAFVCRRCGAPRETSGPSQGEATVDACAGCGDRAVRQVNWDGARAAAAMPGCRTVTVEGLVPGSGRTVVLLDFDSTLRRPGMHPESWPLHLFARAASAAGRGGRVVLVARGTHPLCEDLQQHDLMAQARRSWESARAEGLPPFELWMRVLCATGRPPSTDGWPGRVLGPRRVDGEWEVVLRAPPSAAPRLEELARRLRRRGKTRIQLL